LAPPGATGVAERVADAARGLLLTGVTGHEDEHVVGVDDAGLVVARRLGSTLEGELPTAPLVQLERDGGRPPRSEGDQPEARDRRAAETVERRARDLDRVVGSVDRPARTERERGIGREGGGHADKEREPGEPTERHPRSTAVSVGAPSAARQAAS